MQKLRLTVEGIEKVSGIPIPDRILEHISKKASEKEGFVINVYNENNEIVVEFDDSPPLAILRVGMSIGVAAEGISTLISQENL